MTEAALEAAIAAGEPVVLSLTEVSPTTILERLAADGGSYRVEVECLFGAVTVEVGGGLVVGAVADKSGAELQGREAYALLRKTRTGDAAVSPLRFPSLANILEPVHALPDLMRASSRPPGPPDTVEVALPQARPLHAEPVTEELELPEELLASAPRRAARPPAVPAAPRVKAPEIRTKPRRRWLVAVAALFLLGGVGVAYAAMEGDALQPPAQRAVVPGPSVALDEAPLADAPSPESEDPAPAAEDREERRVEARRLARASRRALRRGNAGAGLRLARRAARLRGGLPYYQVLLGDALDANDQPDAARRAYRRALRISPRYQPALRRLGAERNAALPRPAADRG